MIEVLEGDAVERLREMPDESVQCCVTSPPYWGLRDYGTAAWEGGDAGCDHLQHPVERSSTSTLVGTSNKEGFEFNGYRDICGKCGAKRIDSQLGLEKTPDEYVAKMVAVFREVRRVLRKDGTLWLNLGDSYAGSPTGSLGTSSTLNGAQTSDAYKETLREYSKGTMARRTEFPGLKPKDLCGIPWRVAFALQADGWWLRSDIIWAKPNPMPESVTDRCTKSHEYLFMLTKSANYYFDSEAIKEPVKQTTIDRATSGTWHNMEERPDLDYPGQPQRSKAAINRDVRAKLLNGESMRVNKRSVWTVATAPYPEAHFATYPPDLVKPCIMAGTSAKGCCAKCGAPWERVTKEHDSPTRAVVTNGPHGEHGFMGGNRRDIAKQIETLGWQPICKCDAGIEPCVCLDPFAGSGTTGAVALELGRKAVLIELNPKYCELIEERCEVTLGLALA